MKQLREHYEHCYQNLVLRKIEKNNEKKKNQRNEKNNQSMI